MKRVVLDGRVFILRLKDGKPNNIRERKEVGGRLTDGRGSYWHCRRSPGGPTSIPSRVLKAAGFAA